MAVTKASKSLSTSSKEGGELKQGKKFLGGGGGCWGGGWWGGWGVFGGGFWGGVGKRENNRAQKQHDEAAGSSSLFQGGEKETATLHAYPVQTSRTRRRKSYQKKRKRFSRKKNTELVSKKGDSRKRQWIGRKKATGQNPGQVHLIFTRETLSTSRGRLRGEKLRGKNIGKRRKKVRGSKGKTSRELIKHPYPRQKRKSRGGGRKGGYRQGETGWKNSTSDRTACFTRQAPNFKLKRNIEKKT